MAIVELVMPKLGESITEATILKWHKQPGEHISADETVLEIATDKVDSEVPSIAEGVLEEILFQVNDVVPVGAVIAKIRTTTEDTGQYNGGGDNGNAGAAAQTTGIDTGNGSHQPEIATYGAASSGSNWQKIPDHQRKDAPVPGNRFYSPLVLNIASSEGISMTELEKIPGTGNEGRVTKKDILSFVDNRRSGSQLSSVGNRNDLQGGAGLGAELRRNETIQRAELSTERGVAESNLQSPAIYSGNTEIIEMDRMRKLISKHMVDSKRISAHVTSFTEADVTNLVQWRERIKKDFEKREGDKITFTPLFIEAIVRCIKKYPWLNSSVDGDQIIVKKDINIGMATALQNGNLIVPVIKNADQLNLVGLSKQVNNLANNARTGKLRPDDTAGGTFTFTNVGTFGSLMGTPIINQPQVAILAVGAIKKRPVVIETAQGDSIAIRHMMYLSMSYDHRIIDGSLGATFLNAVAKELENFNPQREY
ncbi:dihydrolipoamide acetyltransferase family protein [Flavitalea sp.]|nr:dihydrolipoamide acetyltransferase family protein [Flavitalea sp.]